MTQNTRQQNEAHEEVIFLYTVDDIPIHSIMDLTFNSYVSTASVCHLIFYTLQ